MSDPRHPILLTSLDKLGDVLSGRRTEQEIRAKIEAEIKAQKEKEAKEALEAQEAQEKSKKGKKEKPVSGTSPAKRERRRSFLWGPSPLQSQEEIAVARARWGFGYSSVKKDKTEAKVEEIKAQLPTLTIASAPVAPPPEPKVEKGPIEQLLTENRDLIRALESIAKVGEPQDPAMISLALFEILKTLKEQQLKKETEEKEKRKGLSESEYRELEAKKEEAERLKALIRAKDGSKEDLKKCIRLLVKQGMTPTQALERLKSDFNQPVWPELDDSVDNQVEKLLADMRNQADRHISEFRSQLTVEVKATFDQVQSLKREKKKLEKELEALKKEK